MPHPHPLALGTHLRSSRPVMDEGDFGERYAPAGAVGEIVGIDPDDEHRFRYRIQYLPSGILNIDLAGELDQHGTVLPSRSPEIPSASARELAKAVLDVFYDSQVNEDDEVVDVDQEALSRLERAASNADPHSRPAVSAILSADRTAVPFALLNDLAAAAGVADRLAPSTPGLVP